MVNYNEFEAFPLKMNNPKVRSKKENIVVVIPAYNSARTLEWVYKNIPKQVDDVIIVDDGSKDNTVEVIKKLDIKPIVHKKNLGYGANQKTLYTNALNLGADYIIMLHPDGQYDPKDLTKFIEALKENEQSSTSNKADLIMGSRFLTRTHETPIYKIFFLKLIAIVFNLVLGTNLSEVNTGYRGYTSKLLRTIPFMKNGNGYIFDPQLLIQAVYFGFKVVEVPVSKKYNEEAISPNLSKSLKHGLENLYVLMQYIVARFGIKKIPFLDRT